jgi:hypothetical protein
MKAPTPDRPGDRTEDQHAGTVATENPGGGRPGERHEVGTAASSRQNPPHRTENDTHASSDAPTLPANAGGRDRISSEEQNQPIDEESAYEGRESQDKDRPPSES